MEIYAKISCADPVLYIGLFEIKPHLDGGHLYMLYKDGNKYWWHYNGLHYKPFTDKVSPLPTYSFSVNKLKMILPYDHQDLLECNLWKS